MPEAPRPVPEVPGISRMSVQVQAAAQAPQLVQLLAAARSSPDLMLLDRIEVTTSAQSPGQRPSGQPGVMNITAVWSTLARQEAAR
jgi:hypothetical protein